MKTDKLGRVSLTTDEVISSLLRGSTIDNWVLLDEGELAQFTKRESFMGGESKLLAEHPDVDPADFIKNRQETWFFDDKYKTLNVPEYILNLCKTDIERDRVNEELVLFDKKGLYPILQLMIYLVDQKSTNNTLWGVGRGSSVASYCLFLLGVHKIDSILYDLDISEFLK